MKRNVLFLAVTIPAFVACGGGESRTPSAVLDPVPNELALELIRSCDVSMIEASHSGEVHLYVEGDRRVRVEDPSGVWEAAEESSDECPAMELATE
jgi:hypothetical protein